MSKGKGKGVLGFLGLGSKRDKLSDSGSSRGSSHEDDLTEGSTTKQSLFGRKSNDNSVSFDVKMKKSEAQEGNSCLISQSSTPTVSLNEKQIQDINKQLKAGNSVPVVFVPVQQQSLQPAPRHQQQKPQFTKKQTAALQQQKSFFNKANDGFSEDSFSEIDDDGFLDAGNTMQGAFGDARNALNTAGGAVAPFSPKKQQQAEGANYVPASNIGVHSSSLGAVIVPSPRVADENGNIQLVILGNQMPIDPHQDDF